MTFRLAVRLAPNGAIVGRFLCSQPYNLSEQLRLPRRVFVSIRSLLQRRKLHPGHVVNSLPTNENKYLCWTAYKKATIARGRARLIRVVCGYEGVSLSPRQA